MEDGYLWIKVGRRSKVKRVLVLGSGGSGKSTFSTKLAKKTGLPLVHLDRLYWKPGWTMPEKEDWYNELVKQIATR